ncbi:hypothetical protein [Yoonia litorea]|uniref:Nickel/cobalt transporter regulator n=1 Tax=Yoonia litorea TaxID=1123755 RepID=A0A1I6LZ10_9RHOB|nr:hypothetical protein [Yoonia litorea]SFS08673.1 hypothetical protein SAMN05444714_1043 [Yoonia litorea]
MRSFVLMVGLLAALPVAGQAQCRIAVAGTACVSIPQPETPEPDPVEIGEVLKRGEHQLLMNAGYYGLPLVRDGWVYMQIEDEIYRVDWRSHTVLEKVTHQAGRNWRAR